MPPKARGSELAAGPDWERSDGGDQDGLVVEAHSAVQERGDGVADEVAQEAIDNILGIFGIRDLDRNRLDIYKTLA
jgi:hypothetical protein